MSIKQIDIFGNSVETKPKVNKDRRNWEQRFQRWSNKQLCDGTTSYGACGYGSMCDYCENNTHGSPCVRALNAMLRVRRIVLDYTTATFEEVWDGDFKRKED